MALNHRCRYLSPALHGRRLLPRRSGKITLILLLLLSFLAFTIVDVIVVETYYRPREDWDSISKWHKAFLLLVVGSLILFAVHIRNFPLVFATIFLAVLFAFGFEDTMFYMVGQGRLPETYRGVSLMNIPEPTREQVLKMNVAGFVLVIILWIMYKSGRLKV